MDGPVDSTRKPVRRRSEHLMCGTPFWGVAATLASAYFAYSSFARLRSGDLYCQHDWWTILTWVVWVVLIAGLVNETRCRRERLFFGALLLNFLLGLVLSAWSTASSGTVLAVRRISLALWILAIIAALTTLRPRRQKLGG